MAINGVNGNIKQNKLLTFILRASQNWQKNNNKKNNPEEKTWVISLGPENNHLIIFQNTLTTA